MRCTRDGCKGTCYEEKDETTRKTEFVCFSCGQHYESIPTSARPSDTAIKIETAEALTMVMAEDLPEHIQEKLGLANNIELPEKPKKGKYTQRGVSPEVPALGKILRALEGLTNKQARWCLDMASEHLRKGSRRSSNEGAKRGRKPKAKG